MLTATDPIRVEVTEEDVEYARLHPVKGHRHEFTGQLKTLGTLALMKVLGVTPGAYMQQQDQSDSLDTTYVCQTESGHTIGIDATVSAVQDGNVLSKHVIIPASQLYRHKELDEQVTVGVFVVGGKDREGNLKLPSSVTIAGWDTAQSLKKKVVKEPVAPFNVKNAAIKECEMLRPMSLLMGKVKYHEARP